jgi:Tol biopolymer transport system component
MPMPIPISRFLPLFPVLAACGQVMPPKLAADAGTGADAAPDAAPMCNPATPFAATAPLAGFVANQDIVRLSNDERTVVFQDWHADYQIYTATRASVGSAFSGSMSLASVNSPAQETSASLSNDGLRIFFDSSRAGGTHIYVATRAATTESFGIPELVTDIMAPTGISDEAHTYIRADGRELWFTSARSGSIGGRDLYRAEANGSGFSAPEQMMALESTGDEYLPVVSADGLTVYFASNRPGGAGSFDIWTAHRSTLSDGFGTPVPVRELNTASTELPTWLSPDGCRLYMSRDTIPKVAERHPE